MISKGAATVNTNKIYWSMQTIISTRLEHKIYWSMQTIISTRLEHKIYWSMQTIISTSEVACLPALSMSILRDDFG
jgi:hydrogenase maturation factor HypE